MYEVGRYLFKLKLYLRYLKRRNEQMKVEFLIRVLCMSQPTNYNAHDYNKIESDVEVTYLYFKSSLPIGKSFSSKHLII